MVAFFWVALFADVSQVEEIMTQLSYRQVAGYDVAEVLGAATSDDTVSKVRRVKIGFSAVLGLFSFLLISLAFLKGVWRRLKIFAFVLGGSAALALALFWWKFLSDDFHVVGSYERMQLFLLTLFGGVGSAALCWFGSLRGLGRVTVTLDDVGDSTSSSVSEDLLDALKARDEVEGGSDESAPEGAAFSAGLSGEEESASLAPEESAKEEPVGESLSPKGLEIVDPPAEAPPALPTDVSAAPPTLPEEEAGLEEAPPPVPETVESSASELPPDFPPPDLPADLEAEQAEAPPALPTDVSAAPPTLPEEEAGLEEAPPPVPETVESSASELPPDFPPPDLPANLEAEQAEAPPALPTDVSAAPPTLPEEEAGLEEAPPPALPADGSDEPPPLP